MTTPQYTTLSLTNPQGQISHGLGRDTITPTPTPTKQMDTSTPLNSIEQQLFDMVLNDPNRF